jgi:hypothetical protein
MGREPWYESDNPSRVARGVSWRAGLWVIGIVVFFALLSAGIWALKVATSDVRGAGDQTQKVNSANNRIFAQEHFFTLYNNVLAYDQQLDQAAADKAEHPGDTYFAINYSGLVKTCIDARNQYNADANKVTQAKWRDPQLPYQIDPLDPKTDCHETAKEPTK